MDNTRNANRLILATLFSDEVADVFGERAHGMFSRHNAGMVFQMHTTVHRDRH